MDVDLDTERNIFVPVAGPVPKDARATFRPDTRIYMARLNDGATVRKVLAPGRAGFLQVIGGVVEVAGNGLSAGDGLHLGATSDCGIPARSNAELMLFGLS
ncbi:hypothetical protein [Tropicimonas marinistellae]|uniref:pirin family protein n=1 Tax=Tropicimonas marinistellae TaxID=1739787 RepID=UPI0008337B2F|nr:hypothetical protein [Tropicimonas marinistellae]